MSKKGSNPGPPPGNTKPPPPPGPGPPKKQDGFLAEPPRPSINPQPPIYLLEIKCGCGVTETIELSPASIERPIRKIECVGCGETVVLKKEGAGYQLEKK